MSMKISIFRDPGFKAMPDYNANDLDRLLHSKKCSFDFLDHGGIENISRRECDVLMVPYLNGNFSVRAMDALLKFHSAGGSLFFLGDLPCRDKWYPLRNSQAYRFHLTRCYDDINISSDRPGIEGLTEKGIEILGGLEDAGFFMGKTFPALRVTAFPPDESHALLRIRSGSHAERSSAVVAIERKCGKFLGAKFAMIGFNGGEPRENVDGAYQLKWKWNPGLLTRKWKGIDEMVWKLIRWLEPADVSGSVDVDAISVEGEEKRLSFSVRNLAAGRMILDKISLSCNDREICEFRNISLSSGKVFTRRISFKINSMFGIYAYELKIQMEGKEESVARFIQRVIPADAAKHAGFGFSTYWAFQTPKMPEELKFFCREMVKRGCQYVRMNIPWEDLEPKPGRYDWSTTDQLLEFAEKEKFLLQFWMFPTTRGSGLADGGVPWWSLKEPAIDRFGNKGCFPTLWSKFYRDHYFGMLENLTSRYADSKNLSRFILDFGNSDFPYGYYYYGGDNTIFDYSPQERKAFCLYLKNELGWGLETIGKLFSRKFKYYEEIPVPFSENKEAFRVYLDFRTWSIRGGIEEVHGIVKRNAPEKLPPDLPGHGLGSIADLSTYFCEAKAKHLLEESVYDKKYVSYHNAGKTWGGEAWQVGGEYRQYDDAVFQSVRLNATYNSIPGADLGLYGDDIARIGFIRRTIMSAERVRPELAVFDRLEWNNFRSLANVATRTDIPVDLICSRQRYDFSCYRLMALPAYDFSDRTVTGGGGGLLLPDDEYWYHLLRLSVEKGLNILVFPHTCEIGTSIVQRTFLRQVFGLTDVKYGAWKKRDVSFPAAFGGGRMTGCASEVIAEGKVLVRDSKGVPVLVQRQYGKGSVLLAGFDSSPDSLDPEYNYEECGKIGAHTLLKICRYFGIGPKEYRTDGTFAFKEMVHRGNKDYFLLFSHVKRLVKSKIQVRLARSSQKALDLATGEEFELKRKSGGWYDFEIELKTRCGRYLCFPD
ncbi:MAG TPA: hypothetical protein DET40_11300 [Lentisphaeria bacterium]|nr:MAG: hypothetical protein A2X45_19890 [Lentisphaerae bacterium GWF2_50_93]HCE44125.1 hypothetical protein [Lentisphaeria bacterium]